MPIVHLEANSGSRLRLLSLSLTCTFSVLHRAEIDVKRFSETQSFKNLINKHPETMAGLHVSKILRRTLLTVSRISPMFCNSYGQANRRYLVTSVRALAKKKEWVSVTYEKNNGDKFTVQGKEGDNLLDIAINNDVDLEGFGACEGTLACSTCHLVFSQSDFDKIEEPATDEELDMLDLAYGLSDTSSLCISLSGSGFLGVYHLGALKAIGDMHPLLLQNCVFAGASAGSLVAAAVLCGVPHKVLRKWATKAAIESQDMFAGTFNPKFNIEKMMLDGLEMLTEDAYKHSNKRLIVSLTRVPDMSNVAVSHWNNNEELKKTLLCSCFIPGWSGVMPHSIDGVRYIDGGFSKKQPLYGNRNLTINPFSGEAMICPENKDTRYTHFTSGDYKHVLTLTNAQRMYHSLMAPPPHILNEYYHYGYLDATRYFKKLHRKAQKKKM